MKAHLTIQTVNKRTVQLLNSGDSGITNLLLFLFISTEILISEITKQHNQDYKSCYAEIKSSRKESGKDFPYSR